ncbi:ABC transporter permease [Phytohabitans rumicis]|uniref:ABC transporter permease n=1 Tax=Phytohabitans rumicis TaxID=1076125 RepID=A0A6V8LEY2_9ACTN|nr:ABC transporter permease [Phytohabitans rumicis]GFJ91205.1 ABC transporter permease [Phytohabitans rumicis]
MLRRWRRPADPVPRARLSTRDLLSEALSGVLQRPGRSALTSLGTVVGVGTFVAVLGLTATAGSQIDQRFTALSATEVIVEDAAADAELAGAPFPADAESRALAIDGVVRAGVYWSAAQRPVSRLPDADRAAVDEYQVTAIGPEAVLAMHPTVATGRIYDDLHDSRRERVAVLGAAVAQRLGVTSLEHGPAVFVDGVLLTVVGVISDVERHADLLLSVLVPPGTAEDLWGPPASGEPMRMIVETRLGAAQVVAAQLAVALRPDDVDRLRVAGPPDPRTLREGVAADLNALFLVLALICLAVGAVGIGNTTFVAVLERVPEIGLRRCLGARGRHIALQFLTESAVLGTLGGLLGTCLAAGAVLAVAVLRDWTAVLEPWAVLPAPLLGTLTGVVAGLYPALRASRIQPIQALQR